MNTTSTEVDSFSSLRTTPGVPDNTRRENFQKIFDEWFDNGKDGNEYEEYGYGFEDGGYGYEENLLGSDLAVLILLGLSVLTGILGNILVLVVIAAVKSMHTTVNKCLFSLGLADLLLLVILSPYSLASPIVEDLSFLGRTYCILYLSYDRGAVICSVLSLLYITVDRYIAVCYPFYPRSYSSGKKIYVILVAIWAVSLVFSLPYLYVALTGSRKCDTTYDGWWFRRYDSAVVIIFHCLPLPLLVILSGRMIYVLSRKVPSENDPGKTGETGGHRGRNQVVIMLLAVVVIFILCQLPVSILPFVEDNFPDLFDMDTLDKLLHACLLLTFFNSAINPVLYFSLSSKFRSAFKELLATCRKKRSA